MTENKPLSTAKPKRTYQDSIFRMLFSEKENAIELLMHWREPTTVQILKYAL